MKKLEYTLERLASTFTARDIIVYKEDLICASDETAARRLLKRKPDYDVIPIKQNEKLSAYLERGAECPKIIRLHDVVSDSTSILDLVDILKERKFCFVLSKGCIEGYMHFSDLNNHIVKLPFFVILETLERALAEKVGPLINESNLDVVLDPKQSNNIKDKMRKMRKSRANLDWVNLLSFNQIVRFACHFGKVKLAQHQVDIISKVRNSVCHASRPLVKNHKEVKNLSEAKKICFSALKYT